MSTMRITIRCAEPVDFSDAAQRPEDAIQNLGGTDIQELPAPRVFPPWFIYLATFEGSSTVEVSNVLQNQLPFPSIVSVEEA
ncbi:hypothetical protein VTN00DRAFT_2927 [Thermoascus crustaceus]|uniref:uncharacterized protein n=1 Tax=Thermoascus crustaceus TaxID=5088 RepID=UPI003741F8D2